MLYNNQNTLSARPHSTLHPHRTPSHPHRTAPHWTAPEFGPDRTAYHTVKPLKRKTVVIKVSSATGNVYCCGIRLQLVTSDAALASSSSDLRLPLLLV
jgi:hypothetical protein